MQEHEVLGKYDGNSVINWSNGTKWIKHGRLFGKM